MNAITKILNWIGSKDLKESCSVKVKFKKLDPRACMPVKAHPTDAGFDLVAVSSWRESGNYVYGTGLAVEIPEGHVGLIFPRSSISKIDLFLTNAVGVIDSHYRGEILFKFKAACRVPYQLYDEGERIGQLIIMPIPQVEFEEVEELSETDRGAGGYGSSGK
ncbi:MAG: dUTP diphosphatase [Fibrobacter sp.]|nr:dUTP diphosphatase [Fibrobacter sp.]